MASMVPYRSVFGLRPFNTSLLDAFDDMMDLASAPASRAFPMDVEDKGDGYEVKVGEDTLAVSHARRNPFLHDLNEYLGG